MLRGGPRLLLFTRVAIAGAWDARRFVGSIQDDAFFSDDAHRNREGEPVWRDGGEGVRSVDSLRFCGCPVAYGIK